MSGPGFTDPLLPDSWWPAASGPLLAGEDGLAALLAEARLLHSALAPAPPEGEPPRLLLLGEDRRTVAAAVLAALARPPGADSPGAQLILPHTPSLSTSQLAELQQLLPFGQVLAEGEPALPPGVELLRPPRAADPPGPPLSGPLHTPARPFLHLYTGGSTGRPRLWSKTPVNLLGEARFLARHFGVGPGDCILATVPPYHIYGLLFSVLLPLVSGAEVVRRTVFYPGEVAEAIAAHRCTVLISVPAHYRALAAAGLRAGSLRRAFSSGAPLAGADSRAFHQASGLEITEIYGSTETGGIASRCQTRGETGWTPFEPVRCRTIGERLGVDSPFLSPELPRDQGFFPTSDRATTEAGGRFVLLGRADGIVKVGGKRVDLGEIEEKMRALPGVEEALTLAYPEPSGRGFTVAALYTGRPDPAEVLAHLRPLLPPQSLPRRLRRVERLPLTATGKRDLPAAELLLQEA